MNLFRTLPLSFFVLAASIACGQEPVPSAPRDADAPERADVAPADIAPEERERARAEFLAARKAFADLLASALTSEELAEEVREVSVRVRLRRAEDRLGEVRGRLDEVEEAGRADTDEARRLREREKTLTVEIELLRKPETPSPGGEAKLAAAMIAGRFRNAMVEETEYLADVLDTRELQQRTKRLRRLAALARLADGLREPRRSGSERIGGESPAGVVPAGGTAEPESDPPGDEPLGEGTTVPPTTIDEETGNSGNDDTNDGE